MNVHLTQHNHDLYTLELSVAELRVIAGSIEVAIHDASRWEFHSRIGMHKEDALSVIERLRTWWVSNAASTSSTSRSTDAGLSSEMASPLAKLMLPKGDVALMNYALLYTKMTLDRRAEAGIDPGQVEQVLRELHMLMRENGWPNRSKYFDREGNEISDAEFHRLYPDA